MSELSRRDLLRGAAAGAAGLYLPFAADARSASWHARAANGRVSKRALQELWRALRGGLLLPGDPAYDVAMTPANSRYDGIKPIAVAQCLANATWSRASTGPARMACHRSSGAAATATPGTR